MSSPRLRYYKSTPYYIHINSILNKNIYRYNENSANVNLTKYIHIERLFDLGDDIQNTQIYSQIDNYIIVFSCSELKNRLIDIQKAIEIMDIQTLKFYKKNSKNREQLCVHILNSMSDIHLIDLMYKILRQIHDQIYSGDYLISLLIAFYLNIPQCSITASKINDMLDRCSNYNNYTKEECQIAHKLYKYLHSVLLKFQSNVYTAIHYVVYKRLFEFDDIKTYGFSMADKIKSETIKIEND